VCLVLLAGVSQLGANCGSPFVHEAVGHQTFTSPQENPVVLSACGGQSLAFVASTTSNRVDVIDTATNAAIASVAVGMEPVALAVKPTADCTGRELWVSNHVSDSVSVIDLDPSSASYLEVVQTVQQVDASGVTQFDEPVGIAFSGNEPKAYVVLSSRNLVAIVDTNTYQVTGSLNITAQDPRAVAWRNVGGTGLLYVAAFESGNQTELSACVTTDGTSQCTLGASDILTFVQSPSMPGIPQNVVVDPDLPDRDVLVFDTSNDSLVQAVSGVGTLLYGITVGSDGTAYVAQVHARNGDNGLAAQPPLGLGQTFADLGGRLFLNQIGTVTCGAGGCGAPGRIELEPVPPANPPAGSQLATPYGIAISDDDSTLVGTAAASSRLFTVDTATGAVVGILDLGSGASLGQQIPRGVALASDPTTGAPQTAYVLNTLDNSVAVVDVSTPASPALVTTIPVGADPTPDAIRKGRIVFNSSFTASGLTATWACASCHPDGNTDQLLWVFGSVCMFDPVGCNQEEPRSTMPIRGLRDSLPLHWDGRLADPFGGPNGEIGLSGNLAPACPDEATCFSDFGLGSVAAFCGPNCPLDPQAGPNLGAFLRSVSYPPARSRPSSDVVSTAAVTGFEDFYMDRGGFGNPNTCADSNSGCHELPLTTSTNSETLGGFDAATQRGLTDRFVQFSPGITNTEELLLASNTGIPVLPPLFMGPPNPFPWDPAQGWEEDTVFGVAFAVFTPVYNVGPVDIFEMFEEASVGHSGALGRQAMLNTTTTLGCPACDAEAALAELELADQRGLVNLRGTVVIGGVPQVLSYLAGSDSYQVTGTGAKTRAELIADAQSGALFGTLTGFLPGGVTEDTPQPLVSVPASNCGTGVGTTGDPALPVLAGGATSMQLETKHLVDADVVFVDGAPVAGASFSLLGGTAACTLLGQDTVATDPAQVNLGTSPSAGTHLLQIRAASGLISNELPFVVQ